MAEANKAEQKPEAPAAKDEIKFNVPFTELTLKGIRPPSMFVVEWHQCHPARNGNR